MELWAEILLGVMAALNAVVLIFAAYIKAYVEKKAEHLATKEDLKNIVIEAAEKAKATKEAEITAIQNKLDTVVAQNDRLVLSSETIKTTLSEKTWSKQRQWDLKRDTALEIAKSHGKLLEAVANLMKVALVDASETDQTSTETGEAKQEEGPSEWDKSIAEFSAAMATWWGLEGIAQFVFSPAVDLKMQEMKGSYNEVVKVICNDYGNIEPNRKALRAKAEELSAIIRVELGM